ncbi:MAG: transcriptional regulator of acetoin/glycerol metabolism, partial [Myxococcota bacterium]
PEFSEPASAILPPEERDAIVAALRETSGRKAEAAARLGMSRSTLWRKMRELGLQDR